MNIPVRQILQTNILGCSFLVSSAVQLIFTCGTRGFFLFLLVNEFLKVLEDTRIPNQGQDETWSEHQFRIFWGGQLFVYFQLFAYLFTMAHGFWYVVWWNSSVLLLNRFGLALPGRFTKPRTRSRAPFHEFIVYPSSWLNMKVNEMTTTRWPRN